MAIIKFRQRIADTLTPNEKEILPLLIRACREIEKVYNLQESTSFPGANFFPKNATKKEIEEAAQNNHRILSPFSIVKRNEQNKLIAVDYHVEFENELKPVIKSIQEAEKLTKNVSFKKYLKAMVFGLKTGAYQETDIAWLEVTNSNINFILGPYERYLDKLYFVKRAYQGCVGIINLENSKEAKIIRDIIYTTLGQKSNRINPPKIVDVRVLNCFIFSGFLGKTLFCEQHLPSDSDTAQLYGSRILCYQSAMDYKFNNLIYPIFETLFARSFKESYSKKLLKKANYYFVIVTAIAQYVHRYSNSRLRLKELFPVFDEANSIFAGISQAKHLVLKGIINQKELEAIMINQICWAFSEWIQFKKTNVREDYLAGDALSFNFLFKVGALQEKDGISWPNFAKMFFEMENLAGIFTRFLEEGTYLEAQEFLSKYLSLTPFKAFDKRLSKIKPI